MNKVRVSPHGGPLNEGCVSSGTLRTQDLLRAFASEYERLVPFNSHNTVQEARGLAETLDEGEASLGDETSAEEVVNELQDELSRLATPHGLYFGTTEGDGSCFGFWQLEDD